MIRALLYLRLTSLKNRVRTQLLRLRQPKYLLGAVFVVLYFWFFFFRHVSSPATPVPGSGMFGVVPGDMSAVIAALMALGLTLYLAQMWVVPNDSPGIKFSQPEIAFLFPAPISRRGLIHFKVLSIQFTTLLQAFFFALVFNHRHLLHGQAVQTLLSWWGVLTLINLHQLGSSLTIARFSARGLHTRKRRMLAMAVVAAVLVTAGVAVWRSIPDAGVSASTWSWLHSIFSTGPINWLLSPAQLMLAPAFATDVPEFLQAFAIVLVVLAAHYVWAVRTEAAFEEASVSAAERQAARIEEIRATGAVQIGSKPRTGRPAPFNVSNTRWPEFAFLWKNLLSMRRTWLTARVWLASATTLVLLCVVLQHQLGSSYWVVGGFIAGAGMLTTVLTLIYGPLLTRLDLRQDLANADILRTYPLPGWRILLGELLAPIAVITGVIWFGLLMWFLGLHSHHPPGLSTLWFAPSMRVLLVLCAALLTPCVVALQLLVPNGAVILFPGMFRTSHTPGGGVDLMGQRMLFGFGQFFALGLVFLPALGLAIASYFALRGLLFLAAFAGLANDGTLAPATALLVGTSVMLVMLVGEIGCGIWWLGGRFEKIDLSAETRP